MEKTGVDLKIFRFSPTATDFIWRIAGVSEGCLSSVKRTKYIKRRNFKRETEHNNGYNDKPSHPVRPAYSRTLSSIKIKNNKEWQELLHPQY